MTGTVKQSVTFSVKELLEKIDQKLDMMMTLISQKAAKAELDALEVKVVAHDTKLTILEADVKTIEDGIHLARANNWKIAFAVAAGVLSLLGNILTAVFKR